MEIINPATDQLIQTVSMETLNSLQQKHANCKQAQPQWAARTTEERLRCLATFSKLVEANKDRLARVLMLETGKPIRQAQNELTGAVSKLQFFVDHSLEVLASRIARLNGVVEETIEYEPLGVIANISAWNYPWLVGINIFAPALICGNAVLYKPSEFATLTGLEIKQLLGESGVPDEVFQIIIGDGSVGAQLLDLELDGYFFTGSYQTGKTVSQKAAQRLAPVGLELGGKDPVYV
ncbi:MAG: aldehyde dehydrogenase family protein, partial [Planctomycetota bacterium]|nr:aldehyde dehydrogenase family protein [Planctomycetota bacterium]